MSLENPFFPEKMSDFTETPHFNHNSVKGSHYTVIIKNHKEKEKTTETKESKKKGSGDPPGVTEASGSF